MRPNLHTPTCGSSWPCMHQPSLLSAMWRCSGITNSMTRSGNLEAFFRLARVLPLSQAVLDQAVALRQQRKMSLGDALVAGTALAHGLTLVTRNVEDFHWIQGLSLLNTPLYSTSTRTPAAGVKDPDRKRWVFDELSEKQKSLLSTVIQHINKKQQKQKKPSNIKRRGV